MRIEVAVLPQLVQNLDQKVCVVIDVLRATSSLVEIVERGAVSIWVAPSIDLARAQAETRRLEVGGKAGTAGGVMLCGEARGLPPAGFDYGNSPSEFAGLDLRGQEVVLCTSNGTKALRAVAAAPAVLAGALLNARALAGAALSLAVEGEFDLCFVASGKEFGTSYSLEDTYVAGCLVALVRQISQGVALPSEADVSLTETDLAQFDDSAIAALRLFGAYAGDHRRVFGDSVHGRYLESIGLAHDLDYCAQASVRTAVPRLVRASDEAVLIVGKESSGQ